MKRMAYTILIMLLVLGACAGCKSKKSQIKVDPTELGSDKKMYDTAIKQMRKDPEKARLLFKEVMQLFPDSVYAVRSKLGIADSYFKEKDSASLIMAASEYQEFVNLFPYSPDAVYAKYQIGLSYFKQIRSPGRDQTNTFSAIKAFEQMIQQYPTTKEAEQSQKKITECRAILATHFYRIGYYNYLLKALPGAISRFKQVMDEYPEFKQMDRLYYYTGKTYFEMTDYDSALSFFQRVVSEFPKSKFMGKARRMIPRTQKMAKKKEKAPPPAAKKKKIRA